MPPTVLLPFIQVHSFAIWGLVTVKFAAADVPPPGAGLVTTTGYVPAVARSAEVREIVSWAGAHVSRGVRDAIEAHRGGNQKSSSIDG